jgi:hypothetical protein
MKTMIRNLKNLVLLKVIVIYIRYLIGFAFVFASIVKIKGERFTRISTTEPIGYFFEAMYQTGFYWNFIGWSQFLAGVLLMTQRFATIGAMVFLPIIVNVCIITHAVDFGTGTPLVTAAMLAATVFLLLWDYEKWIILFQYDHTIILNLTDQREDKFMNDPLWIVTGIVFVVLSIIPWTHDFTHFFAWIILMLAVGVGAPLIMLWRIKKGYLRLP